MLNRNFLEIPSEILQQQETIWFGLYEYIDFKELQKTIIRDYANIIVRFDTLFLVLSIIWALLGGLIWFLIVISILYTLVFIYLLLKLIWRIQLFVSLNKIIVTDKWIIAWTSVFDYDDKNFVNYLKIFEQEFNEFLFKPSNLDTILAHNKEKIYDKMKNNFKYYWKWFDFVRWWDSIKIMLIVWAFMALYSASVMFFYYLWYAFVYIFWTIIIFFVKLYLKFFWNIEFKIHKEALEIYDNLSKLELLNKLIKAKFENFKEWEISNLWKFVDDKFRDFYAIILWTFKEKEKLYSMMNQSKYKDYIDFEKMKAFIKQKFNEPVEGMIEILKKYKNLLIKQLNELEDLIAKQDKQEYIWNLKMKKLTLENQINLMEQNLEKLEKMKV